MSQLPHIGLALCGRIAHLDRFGIAHSLLPRNIIMASIRLANMHEQDTYQGLNHGSLIL